MISYEPFEKTRKETGITTYRLIHEFGISSSILYRIRHGKNISTRTLNDLCRIYQCDVDGIVKYVPEDGAANKIEK